MSRATSLPRPIRCVLFDMDGVLVDVTRSYRRAILDTASHFLEREVEAAIIQPYKNRGGYNDDWELTHAIITDAGVEATFESVVEVFQSLYRGDGFTGYIADESPLVDRETLTGLRERVVLGIVTGRPREEAMWSVRYFGWAQFFRTVVAREDQEGRPKPNPFPLLRALKLLGNAGVPLSPSHTAYVGDTVDDMRAAAAAGMTPVGFVPPYLERRRHADVLRDAGAHLVLTEGEALLRLVD